MCSFLETEKKVANMCSGLWLRHARSDDPTFRPGPTVSHRSSRFASHPTNNVFVKSHMAYGLHLHPGLRPQWTHRGVRYWLTSRRRILEASQGRRGNIS